MTTLTTEEAVRAILSLIHSDLVDFEEGFDVGDKLEELSEARLAMLSSGESTLVAVATAVWRGTFELGGMDRENASQVLHILRARYVGTKP